MASYNEVVELYVATFNRAPDSAGLDYWVYDSGLSLTQIAKSFFVQSETQSKYPSSMSNRDFIAEVYNNLFNREPDSAGWDYWEDSLNAGNVTKDNFILAMINGALGDDAVILENKKEVGLSFANAGLNDIELARSVMLDVDASLSSVLNAKSQINSYLNVTTSYFTDNYLHNKIFYDIILDDMDDNNNSITDEYITIAIKFDDSIRYIDFDPSDGVENFINTGTYIINEGNIVVVDNDGDEELFMIDESSETNLTVVSTNSWQEGTYSTKWSFDLIGAEIFKLNFTQQYSQEFLDSIGTTYVLYQDHANNNNWTVSSIRMSNGKVYESKDIFTTNPLLSNITYILTNDGKIQENDNGDIWYDVILDVNDDYIKGCTMEIDEYCSSDSITYTFFDLSKAQIALNNIQTTGFIDIA